MLELPWRDREDGRFVTLTSTGRVAWCAGCVFA